MSTADDLRDLRDALDSIAHGALPRWGTPTTKLGGEAQTAAREVYEKFVRALHHESAAQYGVAKARVEVDDYRAHAETLTERCETAEQERDALRAKLDAELPAMWREDLVSLNECLERVGREREVARSQVKAWQAEELARRTERDEARAEVERLRRERDKLISERRQLRARLVECRPWVGVCPYPGTAGFTDMIAIRRITDDTLEEVKP